MKYKTLVNMQGIVGRDFKIAPGQRSEARTKLGHDVCDLNRASPRGQRPNCDNV